MSQPARMPMSESEREIEILNQSVYFEDAGVWAYSYAAGKLSTTDVGKAVLALGLENQADHKAHRDTFADAVRELGGTPVQPEQSYDLSAYVKAGEGNLDSDVNIAKLALAVEIDAAIAYAKDAVQLTTERFISLSVGVGNVEAIHAARIRAAMRDLGVDIPVVPSPVISADTRGLWVLKV